LNFWYILSLIFTPILDEGNEMEVGTKEEVTRWWAHNRWASWYNQAFHQYIQGIKPRPTGGIGNLRNSEVQKVAWEIHWEIEEGDDIRR